MSDENSFVPVQNFSPLNVSAVQILASSWPSLKESSAQLLLQLLKHFLLEGSQFSNFLKC